MSFIENHWQAGLAALAAGAMLSCAPALADNFSEGSFEEGSFTESADAPEAAPEPEAGTPTGFEQGSFEEGSFNDDEAKAPEPDPEAKTPEPDAEPEVAVQQPAEEDDGFQSGSFEDEGTAPESGQPTAEAEPEADTAAAQPESDTAQAETIDIDPQIYAYETRDYGVAPQDTLRNGQFHAATPLALPGGQIVSTQGLVDAYLAEVPMIVIDVLGETYGLPDAYVVPDMASPGHFQDRIQQQTNSWLYSLTGGDASYPIVVYCSDPMCWLSYNGALRVVNAGYQNVFWYRGGLQAWKMAGLSVFPSGF